MLKLLSFLLQNRQNVKHVSLHILYVMLLSEAYLYLLSMERRKQNHLRCEYVLYYSKTCTCSVERTFGRYTLVISVMKYSGKM